MKRKYALQQDTYDTLGNGITAVPERAVSHKPLVFMRISVLRGIASSSAAC